MPLSSQGLGVDTTPSYTAAPSAAPSPLQIATSAPTRAGIDSYLGAIKGTYSPDQVNGIADSLANNKSGVSYQELQASLLAGAGQPTADPGPAEAGGGGAAADPNASYQAQLAAGVQRSVNSGISSLPGNESSSLSTYEPGLKGSILDTIKQLQLGQHGVDLQQQQNDLSKITGTQGVLNMINHGIQSGGVTLANAGAGTSSAAQALARAYGVLGREQLTGVGNQYALGQNNVAQAQNAQDANVSKAHTDTETQKMSAINAIVADAQRQLAAYNQQLAQYNLPSSFDADGIKAQIQQSALAQLSQYDDMLNKGVGAISPETNEASQAAAAQLAQAGAAPANAFNFTTVAPPSVQQTGPSPSNLPLFTLPNAKKQTA